ncbi:MAG: GNAT family N-acetyltransferase [Bacilli bacterium]
MEEIIIRRARSEDLNIIQELNNDLFKLEKANYDSTLIENWPLSKDGEDYFTDLINNHYVIVALLNDEIVGYLAGSINEKGSYEEIQYGELNNMLIKENCRGYGIGKKLINSFKNYCKENNISNVKVTASYKNQDAINFYKKNGFSEFDLTLTMKID